MILFVAFWIVCSVLAYSRWWAHWAKEEVRYKSYRHQDEILTMLFALVGGPVALGMWWLMTMGSGFRWR